MVSIIDGNKIAQDIRNEVRQSAISLKEQKGIIPGLAVVLVGEDPASQIYVGKKAKRARKLVSSPVNINCLPTLVRSGCWKLLPS